ncbi:hypothetical protein MTO96_033326 [Rhipicephalus appendiculatus]
MIGGYIVRVMTENWNCERCIQLVEKEVANSPTDRLIKYQDRGGLKYHTDELVSVLMALKPFVDIVFVHRKAINKPLKLKWSEIDLLVFEVLGETRRDPLSSRGLLNIDATDNGMIRTCVRFEKEDIRKLLVALRIPEMVVTAKRVPIYGDEALCITLRRLAYPNRLKDIEDFFGRHSSTISPLTTEVLRYIDEKFFQLLDDGNNRSWLTIDTLENFAKVRSNESGLEAALVRVGDCNFGSSQAYAKLEKLVQGHYCLYGDPAYPLRPLLLKPYSGASLTPEQVAFNKAMSSVRQAVEWGFGKIAGLSGFVDLKKKTKRFSARM